MKHLLLLVALLCAFSVSALAQIPSVKVENFKGEVVDASTMVDGKTPMIISFWSTICKPCIRELDAINELLPDWAEEANFRVVAVSTDDNRFLAKAKALTQGHGWSDFVLLFDKNQELMRAMNVTLTPQVFVVDASGKIIYSHTGYTPGSEEELLKVIKGAK